MFKVTDPSPFWQMAGIAVGVLVIVRAILYFTTYK